VNLMRKIGLTLFLIFLFSIVINVAQANVPSIINLGTKDVANGRTLIITVSHASPSSNHYVSQLEVKINEDTQVVQLEPQMTSTFTETITIAATGSIQVRAFCTVHGWSSWASLGGDTNTSGDQSEGISGFPLLAVALGLGVLLFSNRYR
jgi:desulfoferrodoxin (superoxide reductase-like protein)